MASLLLGGEQGFPVAANSTMARDSQGALERARRDLAAGRPDLARDRLTGYLYSLHRRGDYSQEAYQLLGEAYFAMRDYAKAGAAWLLTERIGQDADLAIQCFHERYGRDGTNILRIVKPHARSEEYPALVQERLKGWGYQYKLYRPRSNPHVATEFTEEPAKGLRPIELGCLIGLCVIAFVTILFFLVR